LNSGNVKKYFDAQSSRYHCKSKKGLWNVIKQKEKSAVINMLELERKDFILDAGCGSGYYLSALAERGCRAEGFDFSSKMVAEAKEHGLVASVVNIEEGMGHDERYDKIICAGVLEFCVDDSKVLMNLRNILKPEGIIVLLIPRISFAGLVYEIFHRILGCQEKIKLYSQDKVIKLAKERGLKVCGTLYPTPYSLVAKLRKI
jgi:2-polyprenyl-3-methyl-5-hydroxy-6-metoxy-1,4-benzoquinol methylase